MEEAEASCIYFTIIAAEKPCGPLPQLSYKTIIHLSSRSPRSISLVSFTVSVSPSPSPLSFYLPLSNHTFSAETIHVKAVTCQSYSINVLKRRYERIIVDSPSALVLTSFTVSHKVFVSWFMNWWKIWLKVRIFLWCFWEMSFLMVIVP